MDMMKQKIETIFNKQKAGLIASLEIGMNGSRSWRTLLDIKSLYHSVTGEDLEDFDKVLDAADKVRSMYQYTIDIVKFVTLNDMALINVDDDDFKNPVNELVEFDDPKSWNDVFDQALMYQTAYVAGSGIEQIRARLISEMDDDNKKLSKTK